MQQIFQAWVGNELRLEIRADFAQAHDTIQWRRGPKAEWDITPLQVADASHREDYALEGVNGWLFNGGGAAFGDDEDWELVEVKDEDEEEGEDDSGQRHVPVDHQARAKPGEYGETLRLSELVARAGLSRIIVADTGPGSAYGPAGRNVVWDRDAKERYGDLVMFAETRPPSQSGCRYASEWQAPGDGSGRPPSYRFCVYV